MLFGKDLVSEIWCCFAPIGKRMATYSQKSEAGLLSAHPALQKVFRDVLADGFDHSILCGHRGEEAQNEAVRTGHSKTPYPTSSHNKWPSLAVDALPYPVEWEALQRGDDIAVVRVGLFAGYVLKTAKALGVKLRWGGDWDTDFNVREHNFQDWAHFEVIE